MVMLSLIYLVELWSCIWGSEPNPSLVNNNHRGFPPRPRKYGGRGTKRFKGPHYKQPKPLPRDAHYRGTGEISRHFQTTSKCSSK